MEKGQRTSSTTIPMGPGRVKELCGFARKAFLSFREEWKERTIQETMQELSQVLPGCLGFFVRRRKPEPDPGLRDQAIRWLEQDRSGRTDLSIKDGIYACLLSMRWSNACRSFSDQLHRIAILEGMMREAIHAGATVVQIGYDDYAILKQGADLQDNEIASAETARMRASGHLGA